MSSLARVAWLILAFNNPRRTRMPAMVSRPSDLRHSRCALKTHLPALLGRRPALPVHQSVAAVAALAVGHGATLWSSSNLKEPYQGMGDAALRPAASDGGSDNQPWQSVQQLQGGQPAPAAGNKSLGTCLSKAPGFTVQGSCGAAPGPNPSPHLLLRLQAAGLCQQRTWEWSADASAPFASHAHERRRCGGPMRVLWLP